MSRKQLVEALERLKDYLQKTDLSSKASGDFHDFNASQKQYFLSGIRSCINELKQIDIDGIFEIQTLEDREKVKAVKKTLREIEHSYLEKNQKSLPLLIQDTLSEIRTLKGKETFRIRIPKLPPTISSEVALDLQEIEKCFNAACYRSVTILCGRVLETALHKKYYDVTGNDILETNPGIGLGKLIAKLREKNFNFDPGISEQIHLINQVRISSVHKKGSSFSPTKQQANAMILYTVDVLKRLFENGSRETGSSNSHTFHN